MLFFYYYTLGLAPRGLLMGAASGVSIPLIAHDPVPDHKESFESIVPNYSTLISTRDLYFLAV